MKDLKQQLKEMPAEELRGIWNKYCKLNGLDFFMIHKMSEFNVLMSNEKPLDLIGCVDRAFNTGDDYFTRQSLLQESFESDDIYDFLDRRLGDFSEIDDLADYIKKNPEEFKEFNPKAKNA